ncbi:MAG TPA: SRPBCC family protein [Acidimicrobiales bacterium]|nr:SRPBCC family protein [Acidimicrobiales bacterium]
MQLENRFAVAAPVEEAWKVLLDVERVARCMPGATLDKVEGDEFTGRVKVKVGPIVVTYQGKAKFVETDEKQHRAVIDASGKEARGSGTAKASVSTSLSAAGDHTDVIVLTDLNVTGRPAQFGRGVIADVATKLTEKFATNLAAELAGPAPEAAEPAPPEENGSARERAGRDGSRSDGPAAVPTVTTPAAPDDHDTIDLLELARPQARRLLPVLTVAGLVLVVVMLLRRGRRRR